jgi:MinD-like ATPase involved in chromosome partitioning or flagellar assembly
MGKVVTFYSYKGGTGRTMALANVAWVLASNGYRVLAVDWDLEAPGLHRYFRPFLVDTELSGPASQGVIDLMVDFAVRLATPADPDESTHAGWYRSYADISKWTKKLSWPGGETAVMGLSGSIDFVPAGRQDAQYAKRVNSFDWTAFYERFNGGAFIDALRGSMTSYDWVLIDSRTGVSDTSGICTVQLPDVLVVCFTLNYQSIKGSAAVVSSVRALRPDIRIVPVPMRIDGSEEKLLARMKNYARDVFTPFLDSGIDASEYWLHIDVPYFARYAYSEKLAPFEDQVSISTSTLPAVERITAYVTNGAVSKLNPLPEEQRTAALEVFERLPDDAYVERAPRAPLSHSRSVVRKSLQWVELHRFGLSLCVLALVTIIITGQFLLLRRSRSAAKQANLQAEQAKLEAEQATKTAADLAAVAEPQRGGRSADAWSKAPPSQAWCYQQYRRRTQDRLPFSIHCLSAEQFCNQARSGSATATGCTYVANIPPKIWRPNPKGWMDSWFQYSLEPFPPPFPQLDPALYKDR